MCDMLEREIQTCIQNRTKEVNYIRLTMCGVRSIKLMSSMTKIHP